MAIFMPGIGKTTTPQGREYTYLTAMAKAKSKCQLTLVISKKAFSQGLEKFLPSSPPSKDITFIRVTGGTGEGRVSGSSFTIKTRTIFMLDNGITMKGIVNEAICCSRTDSTKVVGKVGKCKG